MWCGRGGCLGRRRRRTCCCGSHRINVGARSHPNWGRAGWGSGDLASEWFLVEMEIGNWRQEELGIVLDGCLDRGLGLYATETLQIGRWGPPNFGVIAGPGGRPHSKPSTIRVALSNRAPHERRDFATAPNGNVVFFYHLGPSTVDSCWHCANHPTFLSSGKISCFMSAMSCPAVMSWNAIVSQRGSAARWC